MIIKQTLDLSVFFKKNKKLSIKVEFVFRPATVSKWQN
jgi:hypothetical protein